MIFKVISIAFITCIITVVMKQYKSEYAIAAAVCGGILIFVLTVPNISQTFAELKSFADRTGIGREMISPALKAVGIAYITAYTAELCRDAGENALAAKVEMAGKIIMLSIALPVAAAMFDAIERILP